jgi:hypothetical protein
VSGNTVSVKLIASSLYGTATTATLTVGSTKANYSVTTLAAVTTPYAFSFVTVHTATLNTVYYSNLIAVDGINAPTSISIIGGVFSINGAAYTSIPGTVLNGDRVKVGCTSSSNQAVVTSALLSIGGISALFSIEAGISTPNAVYFTPSTNLAANTVYTSSLVQVGGINLPSTIVANSCMYSINNAAYTNSPGIILNGDWITLQATSSNIMGYNSHVSISLGGLGVDWSLTTGAIDVIPNPFSFTAVANATVNTLYTSNAITVAGINSPSPISIVGGAYSINGAAYTSASSTVTLGDTVSLRVTSGSTASSNIVASLTIGGVTSSFKVIAQAAILNAPTQFFFTSAQSALNTLCTSNTVNITGTNVPVTISIVGGTYQLQALPYTSNDGIITGSTLTSGQSISVRLTSSPLFSDVRSATLTVGGTSATYTVTTVAAIVKPAQFAFSTVTNAAYATTFTSNSIQIVGINAPSPISITGGTYSIAGAPYTAANGVVTLNNTITVRGLSGSLPGSVTNVTLTVGGTSATYVISTITAHIIPVAFGFASSINVQPKTLYTSNSISITGINAPSPISITGGEYLIGASTGVWTSSAGTILSGQALTVRALSSDKSFTSVFVTVTIGGVAGTYTITTVAFNTVPAQFTFTPVIDAIPGTLYNSNTISVSGITIPSPISITGGEYQTSSSLVWIGSGSTVMPCNVNVRGTAGLLSGAVQNVVLTVGGVSATYKITTTTKDLIPNAFSFPALINATPNTLCTSFAAVITGINAPSPISVSSADGSTCEYRVSQGPWLQTASTITVGQPCQVRFTSSASNAVTSIVTLTVGGVSADYKVTTVVAKIAASTFVFDSVVNVQPNTLYTSNTVTISGMNVPSPISITGGEYRIGASTGVWTSDPGTILTGQLLTVRQLSSDVSGAKATVNVTVGGTVGVYIVTNVIFILTPTAFTFISSLAKLNTQATSNTVTMLGINVPTPISIDVGEYCIGDKTIAVNWTSADDFITLGKTLTVRNTSSYASNDTTIATITVGTYSTVYKIATMSGASGKGYMATGYCMYPATNVNVASTAYTNLVTSRIYATETVAAQLHSLRSGSYRSVAHSSSVKGYIAGGYNTIMSGSTLIANVLNTIQSYSFATETGLNEAAVLSSKSMDCAAAYSTTSGYVVSNVGYNRYDYASETNTKLTVSSVNAYSPHNAGFQNATTGYIPYVTYHYKAFNFASETESLIASTNTALINTSVSFVSPNYGYVVSATIVAFNMATATFKVLTGKASGRNFGVSLSSSTNGYVTDGSTATTVATSVGTASAGYTTTTDTYVFATDTCAAISARFAYFRQAPVGFSTH